MNLIRRTLMRRIAHPGVDFMNENVFQTLTDRHDLVPRQRTFTPVQKTLQPDAKIRSSHP
jgi:hypothetical protein